MIEIEKYARAAASTARTPPNSPARHAAIEAENAARVAAEQFVKGLEAERDELRHQLAERDAQNGEKRLVYLTDEQLAMALCEVTPGDEDWADWSFGDWKCERQDSAAVLDEARMVQHAVLAAQGG